MSKHLAEGTLLPMPSGAVVHPCRLIQRDGCLMWKHALLNWQGQLRLPANEAHEAHIIKTASRLEELNGWVSQGMEPWDTLEIHHWYDSELTELDEGIAVLFTHQQLKAEDVHAKLLPHIKPHEDLRVGNGILFFKRC